MENHTTGKKDWVGYSSGNSPRSDSGIEYKDQSGKTIYFQNLANHEKVIERCESVFKELNVLIASDSIQESDVERAYNKEKLTIQNNLLALAEKFNVPENNGLILRIKKAPSCEAAIRRDNLINQEVISVSKDMKKISECFADLYQGIEYEKSALDCEIQKSIDGGTCNYQRFQLPFTKYHTVYNKKVSGILNEIYKRCFGAKKQINKWISDVNERIKVKNFNIPKEVIKIVYLAFKISNNYITNALSAFNSNYSEITKSEGKIDSIRKMMDYRISVFRKNCNYFGYSLATDQQPNCLSTWLKFYPDFLKGSFRFMYGDLDFVNGHLNISTKQQNNKPYWAKEQIEVSEDQKMIVLNENQHSRNNIIIGTSDEETDADIPYMTAIIKEAAGRYNMRKLAALSNQLKSKLADVPSIQEAEKFDSDLLKSTKAHLEEIKNLIKNISEFSSAFLTEKQILNGESHFSSFKKVLEDYQAAYVSNFALINKIDKKIENLLNIIDVRFNNRECNLVTLDNTSRIYEMSNNLDKFISTLPKTIDADAKSIIEYSLDMEPGSLEKAVEGYRLNAEEIVRQLKELLLTRKKARDLLASFKSEFNFFAYCCAEDKRPKNKSYFWDYDELVHNYMDSDLKFREDEHLIRINNNALILHIDEIVHDDSSTAYEVDI